MLVRVNLLAVLTFALFSVGLVAPASARARGQAAAAIGSYTGRSNSDFHSDLFGCGRPPDRQHSGYDNTEQD